MHGLNTLTGCAIADREHLAQSIGDVLSTPLGSRLMRRDYGSLLPLLVDQPDNGATRVRIYAATAGALMRWEPRLRITRLAYTMGQRPGQVVLDLEGAYLAEVGQLQALALSLLLNLKGSA